MQLDLTLHAKLRCQQRGANHLVVSIVAEMADRATHVGSGLVYKYVSRKRIDILRDEGLDASLCEKVSRTSLIIDPETGTVVTVLKGGDAARMKRYRQGRWHHQNLPANDNDRRRHLSTAA